MKKTIFMLIIGIILLITLAISAYGIGFETVISYKGQDVVIAIGDKAISGTLVDVFVEGNKTKVMFHRSGKNTVIFDALEILYITNDYRIYLEVLSSERTDLEITSNFQ